MQRRGEEKISLADKDARLMKTKEGKIPSYNHQIVVDSKKHFIIAEETVTDNTDNHQINKIINQVKQILPEAEKIVFDSGYYDGEEILKSSNRMDVYVALKKDIETKAEGFEYDEETDVYICPAKEELKYSSKTIQRGKLYKRYTTKGCKNCNIRQGCTTSKNGRSIKRYIHEDIIELHRLKVKSKEGRELIKKRKGIVENVFGSIKLSLGKLPLLTRGLNNVKTENTLHCITYNLRRLLNELSVEEIINSLNKWEVKYSQ